MPRASFVEHALDLLMPLGAVTARRMFSGYGIYCDGVFFAIISDEVLYFKADEETRSQYERYGSRPFTVTMRGRETSMSYWRVPDEAFDDSELLIAFANRAVATARKAAIAKRGKAKRQPKTARHASMR